MESISETHNDFYFLSGGGEMGELIRATDWSKTSIGHPKDWPQSLRTTVGIMLDNPFGMYIAWGNDYIQLYNDGYRPILGSTKHPKALGISTRETFEEIWHIIGSMFDDVMKGTAVGFPDFMLPLNRNGFVENCFFDFSYSPIRKEDGRVGGVLVTVIETTNKKKAEVALLESEERFRAMADNIPNLAWMAKADGAVFWYNKKWYDYTGTTPEQMEGWGWQSVHDPNKLQEVLIKWNASIDNGEPFEMVFPLKKADGSFRQFLTRVLPVHDNEGRIQQWFGSNTDITPQIEIEESLKESEARFRTMAEDADILIATSDDTSNAIFFNKAWSSLTGKSNEELLNFGWADLIHEEDRQIFVDVYITAFEKKEAWTGEFRILNKSGGYNWLFAKGAVRSQPDGTFMGYISSSIDITERKLAEKAVQESENNLRNTILQAPVAMCIFKGPKHVVELANERMFELWGKTSDAVMHKPIFEGLPEAKDQGFETMLDGVYNTGKTFSAQGIPITLPRRNKLENVYVNFVYEAYREYDGTISGILAVAVDVTADIIARQKIEELVAERTKDLEISNISLQKSNAELAQFAYIASHDLQEPLRKISTFSKMLESRLKEKLDEESKKYFNKINYSSSRMNTLIKDVLSYSALAKENDFFEEVNLNEILENVKSDYDLLIEQKKVIVESENLPIIEAIPLHMSQLFSNLLSNAIKFSSTSRNLILKITSIQLLEKDFEKYPQLDKTIEHFNIRFEDNGIGFSQEYADQIFNIFQRLHRQTEYEGTGIGLAMCKKSVQNHNGILFAEGVPEKGATFNVILPIKHLKN